jgi:hypothetical protein
MAEQKDALHGDRYSWLIASGLLLLILAILAGRPVGLLYDAFRGLLVGLAICCCMVYLVFEFLPEKYR